MPGTRIPAFACVACMLVALGGPAARTVEAQDRPTITSPRLSIGRDAPRFKVESLLSRRSADDSARAGGTPAAEAEDGLVDMLIPVLGIRKEQLRDTYTEPRGRLRRHHAIDIMAPRGTPIVSAVSGRVVRMGWDRGGGKTVRVVDGSGRYVFYYAHLDRYAEGLREGAAVRGGETIGFVGRTGSVRGSPHLHLAITRVRDWKRWWQGSSLNPFTLLRQARPADGACAAATRLRSCGEQGAEAEAGAEPDAEGDAQPDTSGAHRDAQGGA